MMKEKTPLLLNINLNSTLLFYRKTHLQDDITITYLKDTFGTQSQLLSTMSVIIEVAP